MIAPGSTIGIMGGGQLGRMLALSAYTMGYRVVILCPEDDAPAAQITPCHIRASYDDEQALMRLAQLCDIVTVEFENIPPQSLDFLLTTGMTRVAPSADAIAICRNRLTEKQLVRDTGHECVPYLSIRGPEDIKSAENWHYPAVLKLAELGYDGRGQQTISAYQELTPAWQKLGARPCVLEAFQDIQAEYSVIVARNQSGKICAFPPSENLHRNHILAHSVAPITLAEDIQQQAVKTACDLAQGLPIVGLLAVEFFLTKAGALLVNEMAPRPHNSGHWTMDAAPVSQFEQMLRAICGLPFGAVSPVLPVKMINLLGAEQENWREYLAMPGAHLHLYGKTECKAGRKMGHVNIIDYER